MLVTVILWYKNDIIVIIFCMMFGRFLHCNVAPSSYHGSRLCDLWPGQVGLLHSCVSDKLFMNSLS